MDEVLEVDWVSIDPGDRIRWTTPTFCRRGTILERRGESLEVQFDGLASTTIIPYAFWYFLEGRAGNLTEQIVVITGSAPRPSKLHTEQIERSDAITPAEAANILGINMKSLRRKLRDGSVPGTQVGGSRWVLSRRAILELKR